MNDMIVTKIKWEEIQSFYEDYLEELGYKNDGFHNTMLFEGEAYSICFKDKYIGFFSIGDSWNNVKRVLYSS